MYREVWVKNVLNSCGGKIFRRPSAVMADRLQMDLAKKKWKQMFTIVCYCKLVFPVENRSHPNN
jgi:hypothetical protein